MAPWPNSSERDPATGGGMFRRGREERGIVPAGSGNGGGPAPLSVPARLFFCALGGAVASSGASVLAPALVAYGYAFAADDGARGRVAALLAALVPAVALSVASGPSAAVLAVASCLVAVVLVELTVRVRATSGALCLVVAVSAAACLAVDALLARAAGTSVAAVLSGVADVYLSGSLDTVTLVALRAVVTLLWPVVYVATALIELVFALLGIRAAQGRSATSVSARPRLVDFDVPLVVVALLVASVAGLAVALTVEGAPGAVLVVSANVAMALRFAFAAQGLAVLAWFAGSKGARPATVTLLCAAGLYLEAQFFVLTVAGLVDVWANFRHLSRGGAAGAAGDAKQD